MGFSWLRRVGTSGQSVLKIFICLAVLFGGIVFYSQLATFREARKNENKNANINVVENKTQPVAVAKKRTLDLGLTPKKIPKNQSEKWTPDQSTDSRRRMPASFTMHDDTFIYCLPFLRGNTFYVSQGYNLGTHQGDHRYAIDFPMRKGTPIHAARGGKVMEVVSHYDQRGLTTDMYSKANRVVIQHSDGTFAGYGHLEKDGVAVKKGERVRKGQKIGYAGETGFANGPHLHFSVFYFDAFGNQKTIPTRFNTKRHHSITLQNRRRYTSPLSCH